MRATNAVLAPCLPCGGRLTWPGLLACRLAVCGAALWGFRVPVMVPVHGGFAGLPRGLGFGVGWMRMEREKGIRWMPWHQEAMKDVARCEKPWGAASRL